MTFELIVVVVVIQYFAIALVPVTVMVLDAFATKVAIQVAVVVFDLPQSAVDRAVRVLVDDIAAFTFHLYHVSVVIEQVAVTVELVAVVIDDVLQYKREDPVRRWRSLSET